MRKRYVRPERTPENWSTNALLLELSKMDDEVIMKDQQNTVDTSEYTSLSYNFSSFKMLFQVLHQSLFKSGWNLDYFALDQNMGITDDMLQRVFAEEGTIEFYETSFGTLNLGQILDSNTIDLCLKW